ncbi:MAG: hypothetical protein K2O86_02450 [Clostridia bacterium]|nr:hypothetical protein [Clostridia bacterium]
MKKKLVLSISVVLLLVLAVIACVACTPNADSVQKKLEGEGYEVEVIEVSSDSEDIVISTYAQIGVTKVLRASKSEDEYLTILWFSDSDKFNDAYKSAEEKIEELKGYAEEAGITFNVKLVKKGKAIIQGTADAVKLV